MDGDGMIETTMLGPQFDLKNTRKKLIIFFTSRADVTVA